MEQTVCKPKIVLANWKANLAPGPARQWCETFAAAYRPREDVEVVLAVPALYLEGVAAKIQKLAGISLAAQGVSSFPQGNYTGSLPAAWLRGLARYALLGHGERRRYFHESVQDVARQACECLAEDVRPILCVDEELLVPQAAALAVEELDRLIWAYTPATPKSLELSRDSKDISAMLTKMAPRINRRPVLYGGGIRKDNSRLIWEIPGLSGLLVGAASLDAATFAALVAGL